MDIAITIVHILSCFFLIGVVLLQTGKGADAGAAFGGGSSQTVFGSSGAGNLLTRLTTGTAILFMVTSLGLTWISTRSLTLSVTDSAPVEAPPLAQPIDPLPLEVAPEESVATVAAEAAQDGAAAAKPIAEAGSPAAQRAEDAPLAGDATN
jgi:preprotein translocase subunit SecG